jgi:WD40 repeat protein
MDPTLVPSTGGTTSAGTGGRAGITGITGGSNGTTEPGSVAGSTTLTPQTATGSSSSCTTITTAPGVVNPCGHTFAVAYSPDGRYLAIGRANTNPSVSVWRLADGALLYELPGVNGETTYGVEFSPDGQILATAGGNSVSFAKLWNASTGALIRSLPVNTGNGWYNSATTFSHDGTLVATGGMEGAVEIWQVADGARVTSFTIPTSVHNIHFSPDDSLLIAALVDEKARFWQVKTGAQVMTVDVADEQADADFSPDAQQIASTGYDVVRIWDKNGNLLQTLGGGHAAPISKTVWVDQNRLLSDDWSGVVNLWSRNAAGDFELSATWSTGSQAMGLAVSPDKTGFVTGGQSSTGGQGFVFFSL